jgi:hypothetical protein
MANYNPPTEDLTIFDSSVFHSVNGEEITPTFLDANYCRFPIVQGTTSIPDLIVGGGCSVGGNLGITGEISFDAGSSTIDHDAISGDLEINSTGDITLNAPLNMPQGVRENFKVFSSTDPTGIYSEYSAGSINLYNVSTGNQNDFYFNNPFSKYTFTSGIGLKTYFADTNPFNITKLMNCVVSNGNNLVLPVYTDLLDPNGNGTDSFTLKIVNHSTAGIDLTSQDIPFRSFLRQQVLSAVPYVIFGYTTVQLTLTYYEVAGVKTYYYNIEDNGGYRTLNTAQNLTHYLNFSNASTTGVGGIEKSSLLSCNPGTGRLSSSSLSLTGDLLLGAGSQIEWAPTANNYIITDTPSTVSGTDNTIFGYQTGFNMTSGGFNTLLGSTNGYELTTQSGNTLIGNYSGPSLEGEFNTSCGKNAFQSLLTGDQNVAIGYNASALATDTSFNNSTAIGTTATNNNFSNSTALGYGATNTAANQIRLGRNTETVSCPNTLSFVRADNTQNTNFFIPFGVGGSEGQLFVDSSNGPFTYNPSSNAMVIGTGASGSLTVGGGTAGSITTGNFTATNGVYNSSTNTSMLGGVTSQIIDFGNNQNSGALNIGNNRTNGTTSIHNGTAVNGAIMNIYSGNYIGINGATLNIMTGNPTVGPSTINLLTGTKPVLSNLTIGGSANVNINLNSRTVFANPIVTNVTTGPTQPIQLGYTTSKTSGWSNITNSATNINTITIDGAVIAFGVYKIDVFINYTNGAANQNFRVGVSDTTLTLPTPLVVRSTQSGQDDGVFISQTISAFSNTTFYIVAQSSNAVGATLYTAGARTSGIYLTRIA